MKAILIFCLLILAGCVSKVSQDSDTLVTIQLLDRNGFSETISAQERIKTYQQTDFLTPQPYQKVVRVFKKGVPGKTGSKITTYHSNGQPWQYLEVENGRAHGQFIEWYPHGRPKIEASVIEGTPDISEMAQLTWYFDGMSFVYDEQGYLTAKIPYEKGLLEGVSLYFHPNGMISRQVPYHQDLIDGLVQAFDEHGDCTERIPYSEGEKDGIATAEWENRQPQYFEEYTQGKLLKGDYFTPQGEKISSIEKGEGKQAVFEGTVLVSLIEYRQGLVDGKVENFDPEGHLISIYHLKNGMKNGDEYEYYPSKDPKLYLQWSDDMIQGVVKTWFENAVLESQREMHGNKKHGLAFAWYKEGDLMLMEEYEEDRLVKGSYFKQWNKNPVSKVEDGKGVATLFDKNGKLFKKITYEKGLPKKDD